MNCDGIQKSLSAYLDREVPAWEKSNISLHLSQCGACHELLESLILVKQSIRSHPAPKMPEDLREWIEEETVRKEAPWEGWAAWRWWLPTLTFAAGAATWFLIQTRQSTAPSRPPVEIAKAHEEKVVAWHRESDAPKKVIQ